MDFNKYDLQIHSNYYRVPGDTGNGIYDSFVEGCFESGEYFLIFPLFSMFRMRVGPSDREHSEVFTKDIEPDDLQTYNRNPEVYFKYVDALIEEYKETKT